MGSVRGNRWRLSRMVEPRAQIARRSIGTGARYVA
jgi:hypothetical protein